MRRLFVLCCAALLLAAPLNACGKKGDPESEPRRVRLQMPAPNPPPGQPPVQTGEPSDQQPAQPKQ